MKKIIRTVLCLYFVLVVAVITAMAQSKSTKIGLMAEVICSSVGNTPYQVTASSSPRMGYALFNLSTSTIRIGFNTKTASLDSTNSITMSPNMFLADSYPSIWTGEIRCRNTESGGAKLQALIQNQ
jgi:hypothetical protein